jgi:hypothetical protein
MAAAGLILFAVLAFLFAPSFRPEQVLFSNDGPLGLNAARANALPGAFSGTWQDLNWLGSWGGSALPTMTYALLWWLKPVGFAKFYAPAALWLLGMSAWLMFRRLGFRPFVCHLGALAACLNMNFFSMACWGLGTLVLCMAAVLVALATMVARTPRWTHYVVAGAAVGMSVMEGFDKGAIISLYIAAFVLFQAWLSSGTSARKLAVGALRLACVGGCAALVATQALIVLVSTQLQSTDSGGMETRDPEENWRFATQWSFPKIETLRLLIPGLFGYGMPDMYGIPPEQYGGKDYWGAIGQDVSWERYLAAREGTPAAAQQPSGVIRLSGAGEYPGLLVLAVALWALGQAWRGKAGIYSLEERRWIWFWGVAALISLLFAFGRYAPFYHLVYALPYFHTIRNPNKWLHPFHLCLVLLFGYGLQGIYACYLRNAPQTVPGLLRRLKFWWGTGPSFEHRFVQVALVCLGVSVVSWLIYASSHSSLTSHLQRIGFSANQAPAIAAFSIQEVGRYVLFLALTLLILVFALVGWLSASRARWFALATGALLVIDLARANRPWIIHYDYQQRYATNPILDVLREQPETHRVSGPPSLLTERTAFFYRLYFLEWLQYLFQFYNVQSLDISQMPRAPDDIKAYKAALATQPARLWELTNTRFLVGASEIVDLLNQELDAGRRRFRVHTAFEIYRRQEGGPLLARPNPAGSLSLIEFTGALPRAKLYTQWEVITNDAAALVRLADPALDVAATVVLNTAPERMPPSAAHLANSGTVRHVRYAPKALELEVVSDTDAILLLNDRFDPHWNARVNGQPQTILRANHQMRALALPAGRHRIEMRFDPPNAGFVVTVLSLALGGLLGAWLVVRAFRRQPSPSP